MRLREVSTWPRVMLLGMALATWPVWRWYALRTIDGSDEPWGLLALLTLVVLGCRNKLGLPRSTHGFVAPALLLFLYALTFRSLTPLPRAMIAAGAIGALFFHRQTAVAHVGLLALSLPIIASVEFYIGYPLRVLAAEVSVVVLRALDLAVSREGTLLHWRGETIMVDAPCGGIRMLWVGFYLAGLLAVWSRMNNRRALMLFGSTLVLVIGANVVRATALFFKESGLVSLPAWTHAGIGALLFGMAALLVLRLARHTEAKSCPV